MKTETLMVKDVAPTDTEARQMIDALVDEAGAKDGYLHIEVRRVAAPEVRVEQAQGSHDPILPSHHSCEGGDGPFLVPIVDDRYGGVIAWGNTYEQAERIVAALTLADRILDRLHERHATGSAIDSDDPPEFLDGILVAIDCVRDVAS